MKQQVAQQLKQLIVQYGAGLANEPRRTGALLRDLCAPHKREVRVLTAVAEEGLAKELVRDGGKTSATILLPRMAKHLHDELAIDENMALWAVTTWAEALGWTVPKLNMASATQSAPSHQSQTPTSQKPPAQHEGETCPRIGQAGRYLDNDDGTVTDTETGLQWMRCSLGQKWDGKTCVGEAYGYDWLTTQVAADELNQRCGYAGYRDWRVPAVGELHSLLYCSSGKQRTFRLDGRGCLVYVAGKTQNGCCLGNFRRPTIDLNPFPNTPGRWFWSSSPDSSSSALSVSFNLGIVGSSNNGSSYRVRLVRAGPKRRKKQRTTMMKQ